MREELFPLMVIHCHLVHSETLYCSTFQLSIDKSVLTWKFNFKTLALTSEFSPLNFRYSRGISLLNKYFFRKLVKKNLSAWDVQSVAASTRPRNPAAASVRRHRRQVLRHHQIQQQLRQLGQKGELQITGSNFLENMFLICRIRATNVMSDLSFLDSTFEQQVSHWTLSSESYHCRDGKSSKLSSFFLLPMTNPRVQGSAGQN